MTDAPGWPHGLHANVPEDEYHADPAVSQSSLKVLLDCPARYLWEQQHPSGPTDSQRLGTWVHALVLGTEHPEVEAKAPGASKAAREENAARTAAGVSLMSADEVERGRGMAAAIQAHAEARTLIERDGLSEVSMWWRDDETGIECRGRIDRLNDLEVLDLKTTRDASPSGFARSCVTYGYAEQAAYYGMGLAALGHEYPPMRFVAVESTPPHLVAVHAIERDWLDHAAERIRRALDTLARCREDGDWPGYPSTTLSHPYRKA